MMRVIAVWRVGKRRVDHLDLLYIYTLKRNSGKPQSKKSTDDPTRADTYELLLCSLDLLAVRIHRAESSTGKLRERGGRSAKKRH